MRRFRLVTRMDLEHFMRLALAQAEQAWSAGENPFGCVIVDRAGRVIAAAHDRVEADHDPTAHCDVLAVREACRAHGPDLSGCTVYTTSEPCPMCFTAMWLAGVERIVFGTTAGELREKAGEHVHELWASASTLNAESGERVQLIGGIRRDECLALWDRVLAHGGRRWAQAVSPAV